jgi:hypothetical protein
VLASYKLAVAKMSNEWSGSLLQLLCTCTCSLALKDLIEAADNCCAWPNFSSFNYIRIPLFWFRYSQTGCISFSRHHRHSFVILEFYPKLKRFLIVTLLQMTTAFRTIFILTIMVPAFIIASHGTPWFAAPAVPHRRHGLGGTTGTHQRIEIASNIAFLFKILNS